MGVLEAPIVVAVREVSHEDKRSVATNEWVQHRSTPSLIVAIGRTMNRPVYALILPSLLVPHSGAAKESPSP